MKRQTYIARAAVRTWRAWLLLGAMLVIVGCSQPQPEVPTKALQPESGAGCMVKFRHDVLGYTSSAASHPTLGATHFAQTEIVMFGTLKDTSEQWIVLIREVDEKQVEYWIPREAVLYVKVYAQ